MLLEPRHLHSVELEEIGERREARARVEVARLQLEVIDQGLEDVGRQIGVVLQAHCRPHAPLAKARLDGREQCLRPRRSRRDLRVARHADGVAGVDLVAVIEPRQVEARDVLEQHEARFSRSARQGHEARQHLARQVDDDESCARQDRRRRGSNLGHEAERSIREVRERVAGIDGQRREHRQERAPHELLEVSALLRRASSGADDGDALAGERRLELFDPAAVLLLRELVRAGRHRVQGLGGPEPIGPGDGSPSLPISRFKPATRTMKNSSRLELDDGEELHPLEERHGRVEGLLEHALVELEPGELPIDVKGRFH